MAMIIAVDGRPNVSAGCFGAPLETSRFSRPLVARVGGKDWLHGTALHCLEQPEPPQTHHHVDDLWYVPVKKGNGWIEADGVS